MPNLQHVAAGNIIKAIDWNAIVDDLNPFTQALKVVNIGGTPPPPPGQGGNLLIKGVNNWQNNGDQSILYLGDTEYLIKAKKGEGLTLGARFAPNGLVISEGGDTRIGGGNPARAKLEIDGGDGWIANAWNKNLLLTSANPSIAFNYSTSATKFGIGMKNTGGMDRLHIFSTDADLSNNTGTFNSRLVIQEDGNVGIGTNSPTQKLEVSGDILVKGIAGFDADNEEAKIFFGDPNHFIKSTRGNFNANIKGGVTIGTWNAANGLRLEEGSGNVGIGTITPTQKLEVAGNILAGWANNEGKLYLGDTNHFIKSVIGQGVTIGTYKSAGVTIDALNIRQVSGNVGIGTTDPKVPLHIKGDSTNPGLLNLEGVTHAFVQYFPNGFNTGRKAWMGFGSSGTNIFSIDNSQSGGDLNLRTDGNVKVNSEPLIKLVRFTSVGATQNTNYSATDYNAAIVGFLLLSPGGSTINLPSSLALSIANGVWIINASQTVNTVDLLFIRKEISSRIGAF
ncbi:MAG TPA: hypothetical protein PK228_18640 [Saprospiraceae bacterium]|nr:hypothetical protein [Saprospiraceae bacterium]